MRVNYAEDCFNSEKLAKTTMTNDKWRSGFVGDESCYCNECVPEEYEKMERAILCDDKWDFPGAACTMCGDKLQTKIIHYVHCECKICSPELFV